MIILASGSPRRRELLSIIDDNFKIYKSDADETPTETEPGRIVEELSARKAQDVYNKILLNHEETDDKLLIIAADTLVFYGNTRMGKPESYEDAVSMLKLLSGNVHQVYTGVSLVYSHNGETVYRSFSEKTDVFFQKVSDGEISEYVKTGEPMDKAGAYAIQGKFARFVKSINGDYYNVVGLPVARLYSEIKEIGYYS